MDIDTLRDQLAHYAQELDKRRESGILANVVTALYAARRELQRLTPQWHEMPTVAEVRARDLKPWLCQGAHRVRIHDLTVVDGFVCGVGLEGEVYGFTNAAECGWWPCDADGIREPSWVTT